MTGPEPAEPGRPTRDRTARGPAAPGRRIHRSGGTAGASWSSARWCGPGTTTSSASRRRPRSGRRCRCRRCCWGCSASSATSATCTGRTRSPRCSEQVVELVGPVFSREAVEDIIAPTVADILTTARAEVVSIGFVISLWSGSSAMSSFVDAITRAHEQYLLRNPVWQRLLALLLYVVRAGDRDRGAADRGDRAGPAGPVPAAVVAADGAAAARPRAVAAGDRAGAGAGADDPVQDRPAAQAALVPGPARGAAGGGGVPGSARPGCGCTWTG